MFGSIGMPELIILLFFLLLACGVGVAIFMGTRGSNMAPHMSRITVDSVSAMEQAITSYITQGFAVANKTSASATLIKRKQFNVLWAVLGFIVCVLPLLIYLIVYASQSDQVVEIVVSATS